MWSPSLKIVWVGRKFVSDNQYPNEVIREVKKNFFFLRELISNYLNSWF